MQAYYISSTTSVIRRTSTGVERDYSDVKELILAASDINDLRVKVIRDVFRNKPGVCDIYKMHYSDARFSGHIFHLTTKQLGKYVGRILYHGGTECYFWSGRSGGFIPFDPRTGKLKR